MWINWDELPDRPDGVVEDALGTGQDPMAGRVRRSIRLGSIEVDGRTIPVHVNRLKPGSEPPVWLFSAHTVDNIAMLWDAHGPSWLAKQMPDWTRERGPFRIQIWQWIGLVLTTILAPMIGIVVGKGACTTIVNRAAGQASELAGKLKWPIAVVITSLLVWATFTWVLGLPSAIAAVLEPLSLILFVMSVVWLVMRTITFFIDSVVKKSIRDYHDEESASRRRLLTQITVARHVLLLLLALVGVAVVLLQLDSFRSVGVTILSSAGAAAVVLGIAGHAVLGNLIAGLQIALAQPFRIGDTVYVENNWGHIEDITYVDVIVRTWDERRLIFPIRYFVNNWFENWSKTDQYLRQPIYLKVDYRADVDRIRHRFQEIVEADEDWAADRDEPEVLVTDCDEETMTIRLTCGGANPSKAWALVCRAREQLIAWLGEVEDGKYLPRRRLLLNPDAKADDG